MILKLKSVFASFFFSVCCIFLVASYAQAYSSVLSFGDSLSDNGYYQAYPGGTIGNTNPSDVYGFRRFSNGPVWVEYLAQDLGVSILDLAYGGATSGWTNPAASSAGYGYTGLQWQIGQMAAVNSQSLITISAGGNDMFNYLSDPSLYSPVNAAANVVSAVQTLINKGGRNFLIMNLAVSQQNSAYATWMTYFNAALSTGLSLLMSANSNVADLDIDLLDMNRFVLTGIDNYTDTWVSQCAANPAACSGTTYAWWDTVGVHPTTEVHRQIASYAWKVAVPEPASMLLLILGFAGLAGIRRKLK
jgi:phospholipase/lecithinase/hemolysin